MTDHFTALNETRRLWLDAEALKQKFLALSASVHPDKAHSAGETERAAAAKAFAELNTAYNCLAEPKSRLLHLLELERGVKPRDIQEIPAGLADLFTEVAMVCRSADQFLAEKGKTTSPLVQVQLFERGQEWVGKLNALQQKLNRLHGQLMDELKVLDGEWMQKETGSREKILAKAEELYRLFGYFNRWNRQIQERVVQLAM